MPPWEIALGIAGIGWLCLLLYARWRGIGRRQREQARRPGLPNQADR